MDGNLMNGREARSRRIRNAVKVASVALLALAGTTVLATAPAGASTAPLIGDGTAAYTPGTTSPPNQFNVLTLVTGGASAVNTVVADRGLPAGQRIGHRGHHGHHGHHHLYAGRRPPPGSRP